VSGTGHSAALSDGEELLFRQVHPNCIQEGRIGKNAFDPTETREPDRLSVARETLTTPAAAYDLHVRTGHVSAGTWAVSVQECASLDLPARPDPTPVDPAHAFVDFAGLSKNATKKKARLLAKVAMDRGALYTPS